MNVMTSGGWLMLNSACPTACLPSQVTQAGWLSWVDLIFFYQHPRENTCSRNRLLVCIRTEDLPPFCLSKMHQENTITANLWLWEVPSRGVQLWLSLSHQPRSFWISLSLANSSNSDRIIQENHWKMNLYWCKGNKLSQKAWKLINNL